MLQWPPKKIVEVFDYRWNVVLDPDDTLISGSLSIISGDVHIDSQAQDTTGITVFLSGGSVGATIFRALGMTAGQREVEDFITLNVTADDAPPVGTPVAGVAAFDYTIWSTLYPTLAVNVSAPLAQAYFAQATMYLDNTPSSPISDVGQRLMLLNLIVAHLAYLGGAGNADGAASGLVGPLKQASEGSVSVSTGLGDLDSTEAFWASSPYGWQYWQLMAPLRTAHYIPGPRPYLGVPSYGMGGRWVPSWGSGGAWPR